MFYEKKEQLAEGNGRPEKRNLRSMGSPISVRSKLRPGLQFDLCSLRSPLPQTPLHRR